MFTGLVEALTEILSITDEPAGKRFSVARPPAFDDLRIGDSIAISGCCLTVVELDSRSMVFQAGEETLSKTTLRALSSGSKVNCERAMKLGDRIGGHLVSGHVDGVGHVSGRVDKDEWSDIRFSAPAALMRQVVSKGSIAVDGTSLTVVDATDTEFSVALIPHTLQVTTLGSLRVGDRVNLETDMMAKYVERQMAAWKPA